MTLSIKLHYLLLVIYFLVIVAQSQSCLNANGESVSWWTILKVPPMTGNSGYAYFDSTMTSSNLEYFNKAVDLEISPLSQTLTLINKDRLERVAWNDEKPDNHTSSTKAHAKGIIAYGKTTGKGFLVVHSIPKYPAFLADHSIYL